MANNNGTITPVLVAQKALDLLSASFPALSLFATDFSDEVVSPLFSEVINTRIPNLQGVSSYSPTAGYVASTGNMTNVQVTINQHRHASIQFTDQELSSTNLNLIEQYAKPLLFGLGNDIMSQAAALVVTGNFSTVVSTSGNAIGRVSGVGSVAKALDTNLAPDYDRFFITSPTANYELWSDESLVKLTYGGLGIDSTQLPNALGFSFAKYNSLPTAGGMLAFAGQKNAIVLAARAPAIAKNSAMVGFFENVTDPRTGLTIQVRQYYIPQLGITQVDYVAMFGVAVGNPACGVIVTH